jgi:hypothetical protein
MTEADWDLGFVGFEVVGGGFEDEDLETVEAWVARMEMLVSVFVTVVFVWGCG